MLCVVCLLACLFACLYDCLLCLIACLVVGLLFVVWCLRGLACGCFLVLMVYRVVVLSCCRSVGLLRCLCCLYCVVVVLVCCVVVLLLLLNRSAVYLLFERVASMT